MFIGPDLAPNLGATKGGAKASQGAPRGWTDLLRIHLPEIHTISVRFRRGRSDYEPLPVPAATMVLPDVVDWSEAPKKKEDKVGFATWTGLQAHALADELWEMCVRYCRSAGPVLDFQLSAYKYDGNTGKLELVADAVGTRCNLTGEKSTMIDDPGDRKLEPLVQTISQLREMLKDRDTMVLKMMGENCKMLERTGNLTDGAFQIADRAFTMKDAVAGRVAAFDEKRWEHELRIEELKQRHRSFRDALDAFPFDDLGIYLRNKAAGAETPANLRDAAAQLLASFTPEQFAQLPPELVTDLKSCLGNAANAEDDEMAALILMSLAPKLLEYREQVGQVVTEQQYLLLMFIRDKTSSVNP